MITVLKGALGMRIFGRLLSAVALSAALAAVGAVCASDGGRPPELVGVWEDVESGAEVKLFKDGTGYVGGDRIKWKAVGGRFVLTSEDRALIADYSLSLTRTFDNGETVRWVRKGGIREYEKKKAEEAKEEIKKNTGYFTDSRDGRKYRTIKIGGQTWMAENLNIDTADSWCYENKAANCAKYGRLYAWEAARTACPAGWRLPDDVAWRILDNAAGGTTAGKALKSASGWHKGGNGTDGYGFSALPGGYGYYSDGSFDHAGKHGYWWTAAEYAEGRAYIRKISYDSDIVDEYSNMTGNGYSVRCIKDG